MKAGADIIAVDGTNRPRPVDIESAVKKNPRIRLFSHGGLFEFRRRLVLSKTGFDIVGSTMSGYTGGTVPEEPDYQ